MGASGEDVLLSQAAIDLFPYAIECKNVEKLNIWAALEQAEERKHSGVPVVFFKRNRSKTYVAIDAEQFMALCRASAELNEMIQSDEGMNLFNDLFGALNEAVELEKK